MTTTTLHLLHLILRLIFPPPLSPSFAQFLSSPSPLSPLLLLLFSLLSTLLHLTFSSSPQAFFITVLFSFFLLFTLLFCFLSPTRFSFLFTFVTNFMLRDCLNVLLTFAGDFQTVSDGFLIVSSVFLTV